MATNKKDEFNNKGMKTGWILPCHRHPAGLRSKEVQRQPAYAAK